ncbi:MAG: hypothetical protein A2168_05840 [Planctomycetes bacterium RBG_13_50_24]|nr:MAG: hypothetical protein A2168_05840 [Planctomycetes bacterium RBG_13_50_24]
MVDTEYNTETRFGPGTAKLIATMYRCMENRYAPLIIAGIAAVIMLPALNAGLIQDDLFHRIRLVEPSQLPEQLSGTGLIPPDAGRLSAALRDMHSFARTQQDIDNLKESGLCPWWTAKNLRFANWRPLDSLTHWLDYRLFPDSPSLMHLHNIAWFTAVVFLLAILYRQLMAPVWMATLAALLYSIDDSNYFPAMWIANRNLLLALFFSIITLLLHHRWRQHNSLAAGVTAPFTLLLSLLSTEAGIATFAYLFAYALIIDRGSRIRRIVSLAPGFIVIAAWRVIYNALGYGATASGFVIDPGREPMRYARALLERAPVLLSGQWGGTPAEMLNMFSEYAGALYLLVSALYLTLILLVFIPLLRKNRVALYWFTGMLLCILPICATSPMNRNLLFVAIGAFGVMTQFIGGLFTKEKWVPGSRFWRIPAMILCVTLIFVHTGFAIVSRARAPKMVSFIFDTFYSTIKVDSADDLKGKTLVVVNAPHPFLFLGLPVLRDYQDKPLPARTRLLVPGYNPLKITRTGEKTLLIETRAGSLLTIDPSHRDLKPNFVYFYHELSSLFRPNDIPFKPGEKIELSDMSAEVISVDANGQPTKVRFDFNISLDDPALCWQQWNWKKSGFGSYSTFEIPAIGETSSTNGPFGDA